MRVDAKFSVLEDYRYFVFASTRCTVSGRS